MKDNTELAYNGTEVYTNNMQYYADEYIKTLNKPEDIYTSNVFTGLIKYIRRNIKFNKDIYESTDNDPYGSREKTRSFVICHDCCKKHNLPNPYETYSGITKQEGHYEKCLDNYTDTDLLNDTKYEKRFTSVD